MENIKKDSERESTPRSKKSIVKNLKKVKLAKDESQWAGARTLMTKPMPGTAEEKNWKIIQLTAKALNISPFCINILGDLPYINKLGLITKAHEYEPGLQVKYEWVKIAQDDTEKAIVRCWIVDSRGKTLADGILGECSPSTIKMGTLKGYQNHLAQTRARNRAVLEAFGDRIHIELMKNLERIILDSKAKDKPTDTEVAKIMGSVSSSAEEIGQMQAQTSEQGVDMKQLKDLIEYAQKMGAVPGQEKEFIEQAIGRSVDLQTLKNGDFLKIKSILVSRSMAGSKDTLL